MNQVCILLTIFLICYNNYCVLAGGIGFNTSDIKNGNCVIATPADLVKTEHVHKTGIPFMTRSATSEWLGNKKIYCLQVMNQKPSSDGSTVSITSGGVGYNFVKLAMKSTKGHGLDYNIQIYAKLYF
ncbi:unnamed protein product [Psylliodes chrysocephalus]|uniref:Salivary secreted peptide n=1 Tax=Psylliodes chrysocephalus TaxID=3402493 RepID=A0A9P0DEM4_9CUCU|nr:unnamed protein product [Psylliodes chrysocephala]